jgi:regulator of protease activity HflC (stomatin/prohibitin superfamily)
MALTTRKTETFRPAVVPAARPTVVGVPAAAPVPAPVIAPARVATTAPHAAAGDEPHADGAAIGEEGGVHERWRAGRPVEDPYKLKSWGFISAKPSEFLVHYRRGKLRQRSSGQGASCFKLPTDTVALLPTSLKEVFFEANQITADNVDVRIRGMGIYRIAEPLRTYRLFNFSFRERAEQKLAFAIADMCRSTAKWLVSNMTVEECIRKRKEEIAAELRREVSQVVGGENGWGIEVATIHIQDVYVVSGEIFAAMQEEHRSRVLLGAEMARLEHERRIQQERLAAERQAKELEIRVQTEVADLARAAATRRAVEDARAKEAVAEAEKARRVREVGAESAVRLEGLAAREREETADADRVFHVEATKIERQKDLEASRIQAEEAKATRELERDQAVTRVKRATEELVFALDRLRVETNESIAELKTAASERRQRMASEGALARKIDEVNGIRAAAEADVAFRRALRDIDNDVGDRRVVEEFVTTALPQIAEAFGNQFERISVTQWSGGDGSAPSPLSPLASAFAQILEVAKAHGIDLAEVLKARAGNAQT